MKQLNDKQLNNGAANTSHTNFRRGIFKTWYLVVLYFSIILMIGGLWHILSNNTFSTEKLAIIYYKPAYPILQIRSGEIDSDEGLKEALNLYKQNDYENALKYFNAYDNQIIARFYSGICYIELKQFDKAIAAFEYVVDANTNLLMDQSKWYLGLIYLMNNQKIDAVKQFTEISDSTSNYNNQALQILKYLN